MNITTRKRISQENIEFIRDYYPTNGGNYCAKQLGRSLSSIHNIATKYGIVISHEGLSKIFTTIRKKTNDKYKVNADIFINPTNPKVIYTLGLLWADGNLNIQKNYLRVVQLSSTYPDGDEFYKIMSSYGKWNYYKYDKQHPKYKHLKPSIRIQTNNRPLVDFLISTGYQSKSIDSADKILKIIPVDLHHYWFRGLFDGDGCLYKKNRTVQVVLSGPYNQRWNYLIDLLYNLGVSYSEKKIITNNGSSSRIRFVGAKNCKKFLDYIYTDANKDKIYLSRKYIKYLSI